MNEERKKQLLCELDKICSILGPSGFEWRVRDYIRAEIEKNMPSGAELFTDKLGGLYLKIKNEGAPKLMLSAHMDEVGFMVTEITERGELKFGSVGGINPLVLCSKRVVSENGIKGVITSKPIHLQTKDERSERTEIRKMRISIGARSRQEAEKYVSVGDYFTFEHDFRVLSGGRIASKALDDRHGCLALLNAIRELAKSGNKSRYELYFAFTCREEIGVSGAWCASELVKPDYAIVIESKAVLDLPSVGEARAVGALGEGALISYADGGAIMDRELTDRLVSVCEKNKIKYQINRAISGGNDSSNIQRGAHGARVALISAPSRYIHSSTGIIDYKDFEAICDAIYSFITAKED